MDDQDNAHRVHTMAYDLYHYKGNACCGAKENPDRVTICAPGNSQSYPQLDFELPRQKYELEKVQRLMKAAYERGKTDNRTALANMLKELIAL